MNKKLVAITMAGLVFASSPALAKDKGSEHRDHENHGRGFAFGKLLKFDHRLETNFVVSGVVKSVGTESVVIASTKVVNVPNITGGDVAVKLNADTKILMPHQKEHKGALTDIVVGQKVIATGSSSDMVAKNIVIAESKKVAGKVTAKTDTSITVTNGVTGEIKSVTTDDKTKVKIDGETKTVADIQVGDSGWVKFKRVGSTLVAKVIHLFR